MESRLRVGVYKFSSCDGCQLAFLNAGQRLVALAERVELVHFLEAGMDAPEAPVDVAFVEGSISTMAEIERIRAIRERSGLLVTLGACASSGGIQALRNAARVEAWVAALYADPSTIDALAEASPPSRYVAVDLELWGCPVDGEQVLAAVASLLAGAPPVVSRDKLCLACKRGGHPCVAVTRGEPCLGPVTATGCGALCPAWGRACYGCFGPAEGAQGVTWGRWLRGLGLPAARRAGLFRQIHSAAQPFRVAHLTLQEEEDG
ncbi:MAG TPA: sulfhydrogenase subunit delta [Thiotrichales bacterium]|nr:sulfhydrogenase subunit delta [Thiotrichales bacterium]